MYRFRLHKGRGAFCRAAYAISIDDASTFERIHVATFYGGDGRTMRADAIRYAKHYRKAGLPPYVARNRYLPTKFELHGKDI